MAGAVDENKQPARQEPTASETTPARRRPLVVALRLLIIIGIAVLAVYVAHLVGVGKDSTAGPRVQGRGERSPHATEHSSPSAAVPPDETEIQRLQRMLGPVLGPSGSNAWPSRPLPRDLPLPAGSRVVMSIPSLPARGGGPAAQLISILAPGSVEETVEFFVSSHLKAGWEQLPMLPRRGKKKGRRIIRFAHDSRKRIIFIMPGKVPGQVLIGVSQSR